MRVELTHIYVSYSSNDIWAFSKIFVLKEKIGEWVDEWISKYRNTKGLNWFLWLSDLSYVVDKILWCIFIPDMWLIYPPLVCEIWIQWDTNPMVNISYFKDDKLFSHDLIKQALWKVSFSRRDSKEIWWVQGDSAPGLGNVCYCHVGWLWRAIPRYWEYHLGAWLRVGQ